MKNKHYKTYMVFLIMLLTSCVRHDTSAFIKDNQSKKQNKPIAQVESHQYGGWHCPDNLKGFPPVDIEHWQDVPVINGRLPSKEEARSGASLIFVDTVEYPNAHTLNIPMPQLASIFSPYTKREELIILIQAIHVQDDSIVGFRYLNGGNGSAQLKEVRFLSKEEQANITKAQFVTFDIEINASQDKVWQVLTSHDYVEELQPIFNSNNRLKADWRKHSNINYSYKVVGIRTSSYADKLFGNYYIQNDYSHLRYTEKFFLIEDKQTGITKFQVVCGPFREEFGNQKGILSNWANKVKELSEKEE